MLLDKLIEGISNRVRETFEKFETENMADKLDEMCLAVFLDGTQKILGNVRMLIVQ